ncbi:Rieske 2Fe-2S domain-containing protein [Emcibacter sp.]|uniref:Rieske 2Fe-2S domain-containing protein n=1 Tax=Emcibacter sp. TaxID=1979954 RepID=UPI002AA715D0|nr:Rieske 2Fe-2S domain-containing protein [Emcibacter sp.]
MAQTKDYSLGEFTFPRGWFVIAEACELDNGPVPVRFFGQDFALYRGESGRVVLLDAYCSHMGTHLAAGSSTAIAKMGKQIEGDSIRCPYHAWKFGPDGACEDIPYFEGRCPTAANIGAYTVREVMGCIMMWHDPEGGAPDYDPPFLSEWNDPSWVHWKLDHLGELDIHPQEVLDNMADAHHLGPTHGSPSEYFENEWRDHIYIQRQGGFHRDYQADIMTITWYTGPGLLLSKQQLGDHLVYEFIANTPVEDGRTKVWHGVLAPAASAPPSEACIAAAREAQAQALSAFAQDFDVWKHKRPALQILQVLKDGPFGKGRTWYKQFYNPRTKAGTYQEKVNGRLNATNLRDPDDACRAFGI